MKSPRMVQKVYGTKSLVPHCSAKRGIAIACHPSVCDVGESGPHGWKSWEIIASSISPTYLLCVAQRPSTYSQGNWGNFGETRGGVGKSGVLEAGAHKRQYL